jgi:hypothetical protein
MKSMFYERQQSLRVLEWKWEENAMDFYCGFAENLVGLCFHLGDHGSTDKGGSLHTYQDDLL